MPSVRMDYFFCFCKISIDYKNFNWKSISTTLPGNKINDRNSDYLKTFIQKNYKFPTLECKTKEIDILFNLVSNNVFKS